MEQQDIFERKLDYSTLDTAVSELDNFFFRESSQGFPAIDKVQGENKYHIWGYGSYDKYMDDVPVCIGVLTFDPQNKQAALKIGYISGLTPQYLPPNSIPKDKESSLEIVSSDYYFEQIKSIVDNYTKKESNVISIVPNALQEVS